MEIDKKADNLVYILGWIAIGIMAILAYSINRYGIGILYRMPGCLFNRWTGLYCPGCGGTRAAFAFARGHIIRSFIYNPIVPCVGIPGIWFMISQTIERISRGQIRIAMHYRNIYLWIALAIVVINFIVKDALLIFANIALLG